MLIPATWTSKLSRSGTGGLALLASVLSQIASLAVTLLAARFLLPAEYGIYAIAAIFLMLLQELNYTGVSHYIVTQKGDEDTLLATSFWVILAFSTAGALLLIITAPLLANLFDAPELTDILRLMALTQPFAAYSCWISAVLQRREKLTLHFQLLSLQNFLTIIGGVAALLYWKSLFALVIYRYVSIGSGTILHMLFVREWPRLKLEFAMARQMLGYSSSLYGSRILFFLSNYSADLVLGAYLSTAAAGIYRLGSRLAVMPVELIGRPVRIFALSRFGAANREGTAFTPIARSVVSTMTFLMGCFGSTVALFGEEIVLVLFQPEYMAAIPIIAALLVRAILGIMDSLLDIVLSSVGKTRVVFLHRSVWAVASLVTILISARYGGPAVAWSIAALALGSSTTSTILAVRLCGLEWRVIMRARAKALAFVGAYAGSVALFHAALLGWLDDPMWVLVAGMAGAGMIGLLLLLASIKAKVTDLAIFDSK